MTKSSAGSTAIPIAEPDPATSTSNANNRGPGPPQEETATSQKKCAFNEHHRRVLCGFILMPCCAVCWVGTNLCAKRTYQWPTFYAPFFLVYISTAWIIVFYPIYLVGEFAATKGKLSLKETFRKTFKVYGEDGFGVHPQKVLGKCGIFCVVWVFTCYIYMRALSFKSTLDVIALFATMPTFVYLMSWIILQKKFIAIRIIAFLVAMTGTIMITYMSAGFSEEMWGAVLVMLATAGAAAYKVLFKRVAGDASFGEAAIFLSMLSLFSTLTTWPLLPLLYFTKAEPIVWDSAPWAIFCGAAGFALALNLLINMAPVVSYNFFVQFSFIISLPLCAVTEMYWWDVDNFEVSNMQIGAYGLIVFRFVLNTLPEDWHEIILTKLRCKSQEHDRYSESHLTPRQRLRSSTANSSAS